ncbi:MAG TPA: hypothetical protein PLA83_00850 [Deltaproteobacteria bacterium]|jgi:hypothetical protein|nr:hypothetical protein [Deltaproteobacteria bacterium]
MNLSELKGELDSLGISEDAYVISPVLCPDGALCIKRQGPGEWVVFCIQKGEFTVFETFYSEDLACRAFLKAISAGPARGSGRQLPDSP